MKKDETQNTFKEEKKSGKKKIIIGIILFLLLIGLIIYMLYRLGIGPTAKDSVTIKTKWGRKYYKELKNLDMKKIQEEFFNIEYEDVDEVEVYFLHGYNTKYPLMMIDFVNHNKTYHRIVAINHNTSKEDFLYNGFNSDFGLKIVYDAEVGGLDRTFNWTLNEGEYKGVREYYTFRYLARSYLPSSLIVFQKNDKSDVYKMYDVTDKVDIKRANKAKFTYNLKKDSDKDLAKKINKAIDEVEYLEDLFTDEELAAIKKEAENKKIEIEEGKNKSTSSSSSSSSSSSKADKCDPSKNPDHSINPCDCIERTKCPDSSWSLICSMEWCEKKITSISKENCNDNAAKAYGTPAAGATSWSDYEGACIVNIEATK
ncbi:MAG: hypothetical protein IKX00_02155 [Bacilli bacterium]|nr:hypothetical protein [Bacilli bacterium]